MSLQNPLLNSVHAIECPICMECIDSSDLHVTSCNHTYCNSCAKQWHKVLKNKPCPFCRADIYEIPESSDGDIETGTQGSTLEQNINLANTEASRCTPMKSVIPVIIILYAAKLFFFH